MNRQEALASYRKSGVPILGVLPGRYPRELPMALGMAAVELWDPPIEPFRAGRHLQPFVCSVAQRCLEQVLVAEDAVAGYLYPHLCDSVQNLFTVVRDGLNHGVPGWMFYPPRAGAAGEGGADYVAAQLRELAQTMRPLAAQAATDESMAAAGSRVASLNAALMSLYERRARGESPLSNRAFYDLVRQAEFAPAEAVVSAIGSARGESNGAEKVHRKIVLSGLLPDRELLRLLDDRNVRVVEDDLLSCGRRLLRGGYPVDDDPWLAAGRAVAALPPCSSVASSIAERGEFLMELVRNSGAEAVVFHTIKFCEMELFDHPFLVRWLKDNGVATLLLETELHQAHYGQVETRLDAFLEMIG